MNTWTRRDVLALAGAAVLSPLAHAEQRLTGVRVLRVDPPRVLSPDRFGFAGFYRLPVSGFGVNFFGGPSIALRTVAGEPRLFIFARLDVPGVVPSLAEVRLPAGAPHVAMGSSPDLVVVKHWGDITTGKVITDGGDNAFLLGGIWWDSVLNGVWWTYTTNYVPTGTNPVLCCTLLDDKAGTFRTFGPWRITDRSARFTQGSITAIPASWSASHLGAGRWIGVAGGTGSGMAQAPMGTSLLAVRLFDPVTTPASAIAGTVYGNSRWLLRHDAEHRQSRDTAYQQCGWPTGNAPASECKGGVLLSPPAPLFCGNEPAMGEFDNAPHCHWFGNGRGIVYLGTLARTPSDRLGNPIHSFYGASGSNVTCCHGRFDPWWQGTTGPGCEFRGVASWIYDEAPLAMVAAGKAEPWALNPITDGDRWNERFPVAYPWTVTTSNAVYSNAPPNVLNGLVVDEVNNRLYVASRCDRATAPGIRPAIQVFQVAA